MDVADGAQRQDRSWEEIKYDLKELFDDFHRGGLDVERLNHGVIALIPKLQNAELI